MTTYFYDDFNSYADGTAITAVSASFVPVGTPGGSGITVQGGRLAQSYGSTATYSYDFSPASPDYTVSGDFYINNTGGLTALYLRYTESGGNYLGYSVLYNGGLIRLRRHDSGGATTNLGTGYSVADTVGLTYNIKLEAEGSELRMYVDGVLRETVTDSNYTAGGSGIYANSYKVRIDSMTIADLAGAADTTAPTLTSPAATATGSTTASGSVSTDEGNGTLYYLASTNATETATTVKAGSSQAVSATGTQSVSFTGLTASTTYYAHYLHRDAAGNDSAVASSASFTTAAPAGDETAPTLTGSIMISALTTTSYTATWPAGSDNVAVTGYEYQIDASGWTSVGTALTVNISGRTPSTTESFQVRAFDAAGNRSTALTQSVTLATPVAGVTIAEPLKNNTGTLRANESGVGVALLQTGDFTYGLTTDASGVLETVTGAVAGQSYYVVIKTADGGVGITGPITAS